MNEQVGKPQVEWYCDMVEGERWDDLRSPATAINPPGQASDPDVEATSGLLLFSGTGTELVYVLQQMPHEWLERSNIIPHVHWQKTTSAAGDVQWRLRYKHAPIGEVMDADWSAAIDVTDTVEGTPDTDTADMHLISSFGELDMSTRRISHCILYELSRIGGSDTYGADARLLEFDAHFRRDSMGSEQQFVKQVTKGNVGI